MLVDTDDVLLTSGYRRVDVGSGLARLSADVDKACGSCYTYDVVPSGAGGATLLVRPLRGFTVSSISLVPECILRHRIRGTAYQRAQSTPFIELLIFLVVKTR